MLRKLRKPSIAKGWRQFLLRKVNQSLLLFFVFNTLSFRRRETRIVWEVFILGLTLFLWLHSGNLWIYSPEYCTLNFLSDLQGGDVVSANLWVSASAVSQNDLHELIERLSGEELYQVGDVSRNGKTAYCYIRSGNYIARVRLARTSGVWKIAAIAAEGVVREQR